MVVLTRKKIKLCVFLLTAGVMIYYLCNDILSPSKIAIPTKRSLKMLRSMYYLNGASSSEIIPQLRYTFRTEQILECNRNPNPCIFLPDDREVIFAWLEHIIPLKRGSLSNWVYATLTGWKVPHYDATAFLTFFRNIIWGSSPEHFMLSSTQWKYLFLDKLQQLQMILDIGAGSGDLTSTIAPLFSSAVITTEISYFLSLMLHSHGYQVIKTNNITDGSFVNEKKFQVVSAMNV